MKFKLFLLLLVAYTFTSINDVNAAFISKKSHATQSSESTVTAPKNISNRQHLMNNLEAAKNIALHKGLNANKPNSDTSGWEGIVALCCGILGLFLLFPAIPAIIFGALGLRKGKAHRGLATAGLVLGIVTIALFLLLVLLVASVFWWGI